MRIQTSIIEECNKRGLKGDQIPCISHVQNDPDGYIHFNIEAWSTFKYSYRKKDGRYIREGIRLDDKGISESELVEKVLIEQARRFLFIEGYQKALNDAGGDARRVVVLSRENARFLIVDKETAYAKENHVYFRVYSTVTGMNHTVWSAFNAQEAVKIHLEYHPKTCIVGVDTITREQWEREFQERERVRLHQSQVSRGRVP